MMSANEIEQRELVARFSDTSCDKDCDPEMDAHSEECIKTQFAVGRGFVI